MKPDDATDCFHTYSSSSADVIGEEYSLEVAVLWEYTWTIDGVAQGPFGDTTVSTAFNYAVGEIQAVES